MVLSQFVGGIGPVVDRPSCHDIRQLSSVYTELIPENAFKLSPNYTIYGYRILHQNVYSVLVTLSYMLNGYTLPLG